MSETNDLTTGSVRDEDAAAPSSECPACEYEGGEWKCSVGEGCLIGEANKERSAAPIREQTMVAKFASTDEDAAEIKRICEVAVAAFLTPSEQTASALFELGAVAVVGAAEASRV